MDKIRFHETKTAIKLYHLWYTCTYIAYKAYNPRVSETLVKAAKPQRQTSEGPPDL